MKVTATPAAEAVVRKVVAHGHTALVMVIGDGCCDGEAPFLYDHYTAPPDAETVGEVAGVPILAHLRIARLWKDDAVRLDVDENVPNDSFSLESDYDCRFTLRADSSAGTGS
jgi:uncharacterized protein (DUF779 family)